jgi:hypothetical protein
MATNRNAEIAARTNLLNEYLNTHVFQSIVHGGCEDTSVEDAADPDYDTDPTNAHPDYADYFHDADLIH